MFVWVGINVEEQLKETRMAVDGVFEKIANALPFMHAAELEKALFAGIEIHNKPNIAYRYPTATILIINAWELALKAYVYQYIGKKKLYEKEDVGKHRIV